MEAPFDELDPCTELTFVLRWVPSHLDNESKARKYPNVDPLYLSGNVAADLLVADKVKTLQLSLNIANSIL